MIHEHLSEEALQQYALGLPGPGPGDCAVCTARVAAYKTVFSAVREQPLPVLDFDLQAAVLAGIKPKRPYLVYALSFAAFATLAIPLYLLRKDMIRMLDGMAPVTLYLLAVLAVGCFVFQGAELLRKYILPIKKLKSI